MKILVITDLHFWSNEEYRITKELDGYDICFLLGDIPVEDLKELRQLINAPLYGLNGNHDCNSVEAAGIPNLHGRRGRFGGLVFAGFQGSSRYKSGPWNMYTQEESSEICKNIPEADVFLTHDTFYDGIGSDMAHCGLRGISEYIEKNQPKVHIHGHLHENKSRKIGNTFSIAVYKAALIDTDDWSVKSLY